MAKINIAPPLRNSLTNSIHGIDESKIQRYSEYWSKLQPETEKQITERVAFAILSVHTGWQANVRQYANLKRANWQDKPFNILSALKQGGGMFHQKTKALRELIVNKKHYMPKGKESWFSYRDRLTEIPHLGKAKASFAAELIAPNHDPHHPVCLDTHVLGWCGFKSRNGKLDHKQYATLEKSFGNICDDRPTYIVRNILWDQIQDKSDARYWAHVLE